MPPAENERSEKTEPEYRLVDPNLPPRIQPLALTAYADIAEVIARAYTEYRYGPKPGRFYRPEFKPVEVRGTDDAAPPLMLFGIVQTDTVGRIEES